MFSYLAVDVNTPHSTLQTQRTFCKVHYSWRGRFPFLQRQTLDSMRFKRRKSAPDYIGQIEKQGGCKCLVARRIANIKCEEHYGRDGVVVRVNVEFRKCSMGVGEGEAGVIDGEQRYGEGA